MDTAPLDELLHSSDPVLRTVGAVMLFLLVSYRFAIWAYNAAVYWRKLGLAARSTDPKVIEEARNSKPPEVPSGTGLIAVAALAISATLAASSPALALRLQAMHAAQQGVAGPADKRCDPPCERGQECRRGLCTDVAAEPPTPDRPAPAPEKPRPPKRRAAPQAVASRDRAVDVTAGASPFH